MAIKTSTKKPSGLQIKIANGKITFTWKKGEKYGVKQQLQYKLLVGKSLEVATSGRDFVNQGFDIQNIKWTSLSISKTATKANITFTPASYYPTVKTNILYGIELRVGGQASAYTKKGKHYEPQFVWSEIKFLAVNPPPAPKLTAAWDSGSVNDTVFTISASSSAQNKPLYDVEYQTVKASNMVAPDKLSLLTEWKTATSQSKGTSTTVTVSDTGHVGTTFGRVARIRARGAGGVSGWVTKGLEYWVYAFHQFAEPYAPVLVSAKTDYDAVNYIARTEASWTQQFDVNHPVDKNHLFYRIGVPTANMGLTQDNSWVDAEPSNEISGRYTTALNIDEQIDADECMWVRVSAEHDADKKYSDYIRSYTGTLSAPTGFSITSQDASTHKVNISCTNNSAVPDSKLAIVWQPSDRPDKSYVIGIIAHGSSSISGLQCPDWTGLTLGFRAYAYVGTETYTTDSDGVKHYTINAQMLSAEVNTSGNIPVAPATVTLSRADYGTGIKVAWSWTWGDADSAEVAWSTNPDALQSTDEPDTFTVSNIQSPILTITDLEEGEVYYVWVRLIADETSGPWSSVKSLHLSAKPSKPALTLSDMIVESGRSVTASWTYISQDGTPQIYAQVAEYVNSAYKPLAETTTLESVKIPTDGWANGTVHQLAVRVTSESNMTSDWSPLVKLVVATPPVATITQASLTSTSDGYELSALPLTVTATGAGTAGTTELRIVRANDFTQERPDETEFNGYAGEVVIRREYSGETQQTITKDDLQSYLDDTASYILIATITDEFGQTDSDAVEFTVNWTDQAVMPTGTVTVADDVAYITVGTPADATGTETVDIYRLSIDKPELIYSNAALGAEIVDPYPAVNGGYRLCLKTENGDCTTADMEFAWLDLDIDYAPEYQFIEFNGYQLGLRYNVDLSSSWTKDFQLTKYLGGSQRGDWLAGVGRSGSVASATLMEDDVDDRHILRMLADYSGPAHVRTKDGSSFWANVNASTSTGYTVAGKIENVTLDYERTDHTNLDGVPLAEWEES